MKHSHTRHEALQETNTQILNAARKLFMEKGYRAVTTREIAAECGISQPALYYHYPNKQTLYLAMLEMFVSGIQSKIASISEETTAKRLEAMLEVLSEEHPTSIMMMIHDIFVEFSQDNQRYIYSLWKQTYLDPFIRIFEEMKQNNVLRDAITPEEAARFCLLTVGQDISAGKSQSKSLSGSYASLVDLILHGTQKPG